MKYNHYPKDLSKKQQKFLEALEYYVEVTLKDRDYMLKTFYDNHKVENSIYVSKDEIISSIKVTIDRKRYTEIDARLFKIIRTYIVKGRYPFHNYKMN